MFGSKLGGFGTSTSTFGAATPFGGGQTSTGFGSTAFGAQTPPTGNLFGSSTAGTSGGLFGQQSTNTFGQQQQPTGFSFGTPSNTSASGGLFGQQNTGGLFSTPPASSAFGTKPQGFGGFGTTPTASTGGGLFGGGTQQPSTGSSLFGATGGGLFGGASSAAGGGTTMKFNPPSGQDTVTKSGVSSNINTRHQCITAMKEYENKSLEELRVEDYLASRKGKQQGTATAFFGQTAPATQAATTGFSFGQPTASTGGGGGFSFGANPAASTGGGGGVFGVTRSLFGGTNTVTTSQSGFSFGAPAVATQAGSLFGANKPLFGTTTTQAGGLFGTSQPSAFGASTGFGGFGTAQTGGGLLGSKPLGFGTTTTASTGFGAGGSLFNKPATSTGFSFGTGNTGFGATATGGGLFGAAKPGGFGAGTTGLGTGTSFGTGLGTGATTGGLFGSQPAKPGFNFGSTGTTGAFSLGGAPTGGMFGGNTATIGTTTTSVSNTAADLQQQLRAFSPYGDNPLFWNLNNQNSGKREEVLKPTNPVAQKAVLDSGGYKVSPRPVAKIRPKALHGLMTGSKGHLFEGLEEEEDLGFGAELFVPRRSVKKLMLKKGGRGGGGSVLSRSSSLADTPDGPQMATRPVAPITRPLDGQQQGQGDEADPPDTTTPIRRPADMTTPSNTTGDSPRRESEGMSSTIQTLYPRLLESSLTGEPAGLDREDGEGDDPLLLLQQQGQDSSLADQDTTYDSNITNSNISNLSVDPLPVDSPPRPAGVVLTRLGFYTIPSMEELAHMVDKDGWKLLLDSPPHPAGVVLTRPGYYTIPSMEELAHMVDEDGNCFVEELTIGRQNYGSVFFYGVINVAGLDLDSIVHFRRKEICVYPDDGTKPPMGEGLNRRAEVTLHFVWPLDKTTRDVIKSPERLTKMNYQDKLEATSRMINAKFIDYRPETGSWVFEVPHFSKYGIAEKEDEEIEPTEQEKKKLKLVEENQRSVQKQKIQTFKAAKRDHKGLEVGEKGAAASLMSEKEEDDDMEMMQDITQEPFPSDMMKDSMEEDDQMQQGSLPLRLGVSAHNVQLMKASFFTEDAGEDDKDSDWMWYRGEGKILKSGEKSMPTLLNTSVAAIKQSLTPRSMSPDPKEIAREKKSLFQATFGHTTFGRPPPTFLHPPATEHKLMSSGMTLEDATRKIVGLRVQHDVPDIRESLVYRRQKLLVDAGCFAGRSFRLGWGPAWGLVHAGGSPCTTAEEEGGLEKKKTRYSLLPSVGGGEGQSRKKAWTLSQEQLAVADFFHPSDSVIKESHEELLEIALANSRMGQEGGCPVATPIPTTAALHCYAQASAHRAQPEKHRDSPMQHQMQLVWQLCVALWGNPEELDQDTERGGYAECQARREAFSKWLSTASMSKIQAEVAASAHKPEGHLQGIVSHLSGAQVSEACSLAQDAGDDRLALLLAQAAGSDIARQMVAVQLAKWAEMGATEFIGEQRQRVYCLLAGQLLWGGPQTINTCAGLDWKRALALHLWYHCQPNAPIAEALRRYENAFQGSGDGEATPPYAAPPLPPYLEEGLGLDMEVEREEDGGEERRRVWDVCYHLLKLYSQKGYPLEALLNPTSATPNSLDHRLSWHLHCVLQVLDFHHLSAYHSASLHANYTAQLESVGLWHWALFPLLHIHHPTQRESAIKELLGRHVELSDTEEFTEQEQFVIERLHLPPPWIHCAKATKAGYQGEHRLQAMHLLQASLWNDAHRVILAHLASEAIVNEDHSELKKFLEVLAVPERCLTILNWNTCGKVFYDFIQLVKKPPEDANLRDLEQLVSEVRSLCSRVRHLPCGCALDRHCQSLMASRTMSVLRALLTMTAPAAGCSASATPTDLLVQTLHGLPMPEDYALQELRELADSHLMEVIS
ncbi:hypothetical protein ACOMHN_018721 [Nucella lapillus]